MTWTCGHEWLFMGGTWTYTVVFLVQALCCPESWVGSSRSLLRASCAVAVEDCVNPSRALGLEKESKAWAIPGMSPHNQFLCSQPVCCPCLWVWALNHKQRIDFDIPGDFLEQGNKAGFCSNLYILIKVLEEAILFARMFLINFSLVGKMKKRWQGENLSYLDWSQTHSWPFGFVSSPVLYCLLKSETASWAAACQDGFWTAEKLVLPCAEREFALPLNSPSLALIQSN